MEEASKTSLFDVERLQQLSYERSTKWANFLDSIAVSDNQEVINIDDFEKIYDEDEDDQDELVSMEDEDCDDKSLDSDVLRDITNSTRLALMLSRHNKTSKLSESTINQDENHELVDLFNQTVPVINEHNRQMKESGFDRILNTFDAKKIEEKVGGWLRRHNSLCTPDYMGQQHVNRNKNPYHVQHQTAACRPTSVRPYRGYGNDVSDSDDSLHSGETARYIRSSRAGAIKNSSSTTMMIKTYRMVKSTRQALKDKYACAQDDDAEVHLSKLRHRRRIANEVEILHSHAKHPVRAHKPKSQYITPSHTTQKRKVFRKRSASNSCSAMDTSSESDNAHCRRTADKYYHRKHKCCGQCHKSSSRPYTTVSSDVAASVKRSQYRATRRTPCSRKSHVYYYEQAHSHSISSSSSSSLSPSPPPNRVCKFTIACKKNGRRYKDFKDFRLESECRCCNEKRVCQEYIHLADTSTDEWFVENSYTSKKLQNVPPISEQILSNKFSVSGVTAFSDDAPITSTTSHKFDSTPMSVSGQPTKKKSSKTSTKKTEKPEESLEDSFETELQFALKVSKELYEKELKEKSNKNQGKIDKNSENMPAKPVVKTSSKKTKAVGKTHLKRQQSETALTTIDEYNTGFLKLTSKPLVNTPSKHGMVIEKTNLKRQLSEDALTAIDEIQEKSCKLKASTEDNTSFVKPPTNRNSLTKNRSATIDGSEDTFLGASTRVCNSTALPNHKSACQRQIDGGTELLNAPKTGTNKKRAASQEAEVLKKTREESDKDTTKPFKDIPNSNENCTPATVRTTKRPKKASTDINPDTETFNHKVDTPRPNNKFTSTKLRILSPNAEIMDNDEFVFAKPLECPKNVINPKSDTKTGAKTTCSSGSQVANNSTAVVNEKPELEEQTSNRNENSYNVKHNKGKSNKKKQGNKILPVEVSYKEEKGDANQEKNPDSQELYNGCAKTLASITEVKKLNTNVSIKSNLGIDNSTKSDEDIKKVKINHDEDGIFLKQQNILVSSVFNSSTRVSHKDDSQKQIIDYKSLDDSADANNTDSFLRMQGNNWQSKKKNKDTSKLTMSRNNKSNNSNVSSTTIHSPDFSKYVPKTKKSRKRVIFDDSSSLNSEDENDCTIVSSTTNIEPYIPPPDSQTQAETTTSSSHTTFAKSKSQQQEASCLASPTQNHASYHHPKRDILIYTPKNPSLAPAQSFSNDGCFFHITKEHLSSVIGEKPAEKFLKYYIGRRRFNKNSTIYFKPPPARVLDTNNASSSDSDDDDLESMGQYGDIYESVEGAAGGSNNEQDDAAKHS